MLGVNTKTSNAAVMGGLGRFPLFMSIIKSTLRYIIHINEIKDTRPLLDAAITADEDLCSTKSWRKRIVKIITLFNCNLNKTPQSKDITNIIKQMKDSYLNHWKKSLGDTESEEGKLYLYRKIKTNFGMEPYLRQVNKKKFRRAMTAFRISAHNLEIETGRYITDKQSANKNTSIKRDDRFCTLCYEANGGKIMGDEKHAAVVCPRFNVERNRLFLYIQNKVPNFGKLNDIGKLLFMLTCEHECAIMVGKYLNIILSTQRPSFSKIWKRLNE